MQRKITVEERHLRREEQFAQRSLASVDRVSEVLDELARAGLVDPKQFNGPGPSQDGSYDYFLTPLGRDLLLYREGV